MPKGIAHIKYLYQTLRGPDADCLDMPALIELLKDMDKRIDRLSTARPKRDATRGSEGE